MTRNQLQIPVSKATAEHVEDGDTRRVSVGKDMQAVEEVPSSSASSVAPSAATTAAAKTTTLIQEFNDEQGPGWIFGVMGDQWHQSQLVRQYVG